MPKDIEEIRNLKLKAISEAIKILKEESTLTTNLVTVPKVVAFANELNADKFSTNISLTSLKKPSSSEYQKLKEEIDNYKKEHEKIKKLAPSKSLKEATKLKSQIENLTFEIAKYYDDKLLLNEELEQKDKTIRKLKMERDDYYNRIKLLEK